MTYLGPSDDPFTFIIRVVELKYVNFFITSGPGSGTSVLQATSFNASIIYVFISRNSRQNGMKILQPKAAAATAAAAAAAAAALKILIEKNDLLTFIGEKREEGSQVKSGGLNKFSDFENLRRLDIKIDGSIETQKMVS